MSAVRLELWVNLLFPIASMATGLIFMKIKTSSQIDTIDYLFAKHLTLLNGF